MNEEKLLFNRSISNRGVYQFKQVQIQQKSDRAQEQNATILGYEPTTGQFKVKDNAGNIFYAGAICNSGALSINSQASLVLPKGATPIIDAMPR